MLVSQINCFTNLDQGFYSRSTWIYNTILNIYICNNLLYFRLYKPSLLIIYINNIYLKILGFSTAEFIFLNIYRTSTILKFKNCVYVSNFYINIISSSKAKDVELFINYRALYLETLDQKLIYEIKKKHEILLIK
jgi:hypothetical protein